MITRYETTYKDKSYTLELGHFPITAEQREAATAALKTGCEGVLHRVEFLEAFLAQVEPEVPPVSKKAEKAEAAAAHK
jgi:hypothetical protein